MLHPSLRDVRASTLLILVMLGVPSARAQLGPAPGLSLQSLGQPNGPAKLDADASASSLIALGRTLAARAGDRVNILDAPFGAKCDGTLVPTPPTVTSSTPGQGYVAGDIATVGGGVTTGPAMQIEVTAVNGAGGIAAATVLGNPLYSTLPPFGSALIGGSGTGATVNALVGSGYWSGTDDTVAIASALTAALAQRKALYIPGGAGYCLTKTGNPLANISAPITIEGDGRDVSRLVWFLDDTLGSLAGIVAPGTGYTPGDLLTIVGGTSTAPMQVKVQGVTPGTGAIVAATAWGRSSYSVTPGAAAATVGGTGNGATMNIAVGTAISGPAVGSAFQADAKKRISGVTLRNFSVIGQGAQNPRQADCGGMAIRMYSVNHLVVEGMGVDYSRCMSIAVRKGQDAIITRNRIRWSSRDGINTDSSWTVVTDNVLEHIGDDGIAVTDYAPETNALPYREGVTVSNNLLIDSQGIVALGSAGLSITGNTFVRPKLRAINVSISVNSTEGQTATRAITITGNTATDLLRVIGDPISDAVTRCIVVGTATPQAGTVTAQNSSVTAGIPGFPVPGTGEIVAPYPYMSTNGHVGSDGFPTAPGMYVTVTGNTCVRTLNASPNGAASPLMFSTLGFGMVYGAAGWIDFPMTHAMVAEGIGLELEHGTLQNLKVTGNTFAGQMYGLSLLGNTSLLDAEFKQNTFRDIMTYGIAFTNPVVAAQRIVFDDNLWDGDPYFTSAKRLTGAIAPDGNPTFTGGWATSGSIFPILTFQMPPGLEWRRNRVRNWGTLGIFPALTRTVGNTIYANSGTGTGGALPVFAEGWETISEDGDPRSTTFGQVLALPTRDLPTGCLAGRAGSLPGAAQCITPGTGLALSGAVLNAQFPSTINAASVAASGAVGSIALTAGGQYAGGTPSCSVAAAPPGGVSATCAPRLSAAQINIVNGGVGYVVGQAVRVDGGVFNAPIRRLIASVDGTGAVLTTASMNPGLYTVLPNYGTPNAYTVTTTAETGTGAGLTLNIAFYVSGAAVTNGGLGYLSPPAVTFSTGTAAYPPFATGTAAGTGALTGNLGLGTFGVAGSGVAFQGAQADSSKIRLTATGIAYAVPANTSWLALVQPGAVASQTLTLPSALSDGQFFRISTIGAVTALTLSPSVAGWTNGATLAANSGLLIGWDATSNAWLRMQ